MAALKTGIVYFSAVSLPRAVSASGLFFQALPLTVILRVHLNTITVVSSIPDPLEGLTLEPRCRMLYCSTGQ